MMIALARGLGSKAEPPHLYLAITAGGGEGVTMG